MILTRTITIFVYVCDECGAVGDGLPGAPVTAPVEHVYEPSSDARTGHTPPTPHFWSLRGGMVRCWRCAETRR